MVPGLVPKKKNLLSLHFLSSSPESSPPLVFLCRRNPWPTHSPCRLATSPTRRPKRDGGRQQRKGKILEETYEKKSQLKHILLRPDTFIGSIEKHTPGRVGLTRRQGDPPPVPTSRPLEILTGCSSMHANNK
ncbi:hypothetical protein NL676_030135 [Syzygium grande]|nr:hypothetical protein NL676_030135 [Syzygium grande]